MQICNRLYFNKARLILLLILLMACPIWGMGQGKTIPKNKDIKNHLVNGSTNKKDTVDSISLKKQKSNQIDAEIDYTAQDSIVLLGNGTGFLHGKGDVKYKNVELKAEFVRVKMDSSLIFAKGRTDSVGKKIGEPVFTEGKTEYSSKELTYNLRTKKGYIRQAVTKQGEGYVISDKTKKVGNDILCITDGKYTTCDNHEHPDFYLDLTRGKIKTGKYIVTGPAYLVIEDVPLPIAIPFGFFPFTDKYSSGIMMPTFQDEQTRGFGLTNGGYYFAINDYMDLDLKADIYTKGTWAFTANSRYIKRYKYNGNFSFSYRDDVISEKGLPDYKSSPSMNITWSHSQDAKANPFFTFSSSVNYSSSGYNQNNINNYYRPEINSNNTKSSTVNFTKRFPDSPFSLNGSMNVTQRTSDSTINLSLPNLSISMSSIYPFKRKDAIGKDRWYEKISFSYTGSFQNSIQTKENKLLSSSFTKDWKNGMIHNIPVTANFNLLKYITISPSINYTERWLFQSINESWDKKNQKLVTDTISGFNRVFDFNMGVSASTKLYGFYIPSRAIFGDKIDRIRHVLTPSISFTYAPNFGDPMWGYYGTYVKSVSDISNPAIFHDQVVQYSHYQNSLYQAPGVGKSGNIGFSLTNNVEMKVRNDKDTTGTKPFIIKSLIDNLSISGGYNMAADSMQWQNFNASIRLKLGKNYSLSLSSAFDPYVYVSNAAGNGGVRINRLLWNSGKLPRFLGTSTSYSYTLSNETFKKKSDKKNNSTVNNNSPDQVLPTKNDSTFNNKVKNDSEKDKKAIDKDIDGYQKLTIPWSLSINYSVMYGQGTWNPKKIAYDMALTHNLSFSGNIALTSNWKISATTAYDFHANQFTYTNVNVIRNLHCWTMTASIVPFGLYKSYNFRIGVNASMLQDLKYNKQSGYGTTPITWY